MFRLVLGEAQERPQPRLVSVDVLLRGLEGLRNDVFLDEREDVAIRVAHDLVQLELLVVVQAADAVDPREPVRKEPFRVVEVAAFENLALRPGHLQRVLQDLRIRIIVGKHDPLLSLPTMASERPSDNGNSVPVGPDSG